MTARRHDRERHLRDALQSPGPRQQRIWQGVILENNSIRKFVISLEQSGLKRNVHVICNRIFSQNLRAMKKKEKKGVRVVENATFIVKEWAT